MILAKRPRSDGSSDAMTTYITWQGILDLKKKSISFLKCFKVNMFHLCSQECDWNWQFCAVQWLFFYPINSHTLQHATPSIQFSLKLLVRIYFKINRNPFSSEAVVAEWLRRWTWNPMGFPRAGSNPAGCEKTFAISRLSILATTRKYRYCQVWGSNPRNLSIMRA